MSFDLGNLWNKFTSFLGNVKVPSFLDFLRGKKEDDGLLWESPIKFQGKFITTGKIIWDYMLPLSPKNDRFHMWAFNPEAESFYQKFSTNKFFSHLNLEDTFKREIEIFKQHFLSSYSSPNNLPSYWKKTLEFRLWDWELKNKRERWNTISYEYYKQGKFVWRMIFYVFNNDALKPIDIISVIKKNEQVVSSDDFSSTFWILSRNPWILANTLQNPWGIFFYPFIHFDINLYPIENYLKELYYFFYYMIFSLFFRKSEKLKNYYKSNIIDLHNITNNLLDDIEIRNDIKWNIRNRDWFSMWESLKKIIPWNVDVTYYYCFMGIKKDFYPCYLQVKEVEETKDKIILHVDYTIRNVGGLSHWLILDVFKRLNVLEPKSFIYQNFDTYNVKKDVSYFSYDQLRNMEDIIKSYQYLSNILNWNG